MLTIIGWSVIGASFVGMSYPAFESVFLKKLYNERKMKENLYNAFSNAELYKKHGDKKEYPIIIKTDAKRERLTFVFSIPKGLSPDKVEKALYVFKQHFGLFVSLDVNEKRGILKVYPEGLPNEFKYDYESMATSLKGKLPIVCGQSLEDGVFSFDLVEFPHVLISGETGSGKSSAIRSILTTLIKHKTPQELRLILGDLKRSEFHLFKRLEHVDGVFHSADTLRPVLKKVQREMTKRGDKLDEEEVISIDQLKEKLPYIIVCIDEVVLLKNETDIMDILEEISSIGRSLGVFIMLSMQRPDSKLLDGKLKVNLTVRMGFKTADSVNSKIIGTPGSENLTTAGRMILKVNSEMQEIQCPWLDVFIAKRLLKPYKLEQETIAQNRATSQDDYGVLKELFADE